MLILVSSVLFAIGISLLALSTALLALRIILWIIVTVVRVVLWLLKDKGPESVQVDVEDTGQVESAITFTLTKNKDGTWVLN